MIFNILFIISCTRLLYILYCRPKKKSNRNRKILVVLGSDTLSVCKIPKGHDSKIVFIPRSRHVGQSWFTSVFTTLQSFIFCIPIILRELPDLMICNGPGTCIPPASICFLCYFFGIKQIKIIFVESLARVRHLSLSGRLLYWISDRFLVQWPYLKSSRAEYHGRLV